MKKKDLSGNFTRFKFLKNENMPNLPKKTLISLNRIRHVQTLANSISYN